MSEFLSRGWDEWQRNADAAREMAAAMKADQERIEREREQ